MRSLVHRLRTLLQHIGRKNSQLFSHPSVRLCTKLPPAISVSELSKLTATMDANQALQRVVNRGAFQIVNAKKVDLPTTSQGDPLDLILQLSKEFQSHFSDPQHASLVNPLWNQFKAEPKSLPEPKFHAFPGHFVQVLDKADQAGMLQWSVVAQEEPHYTAFADAITMTSFAVVKSEQADRLISWPHAQNLLCRIPRIRTCPTPRISRSCD